MRIFVITLIFLPLFVSPAPQNFNQAKTQLIKIYQANPMQQEFYCGCKFVFHGKKGQVDLASCGYLARKNRSRAQRIEWEHVMPAENFARQLVCWRKGGRPNCKKDQLFMQMEGDMHNLQPAIGEVNGDRSNYRYALFTDGYTQYGQCPAAVNFKLRRFQPRPLIRGMIARSYFYMAAKYHLSLSKQDKQLMNMWDKAYPPSKWECARNSLIKISQGNDNPFITKHCNS